MLRTTDTPIEVRIAETPDQVEACKELAYEVYLRQYGVRLTDSQINPLGYRERFPDRFVMGYVGGRFAVCAGLYVGETYAQTFGRLTDAHILPVLDEAGCPEAISRVRVEYTKLVIKPEFAGRGIGRRFLGMTHSRHFLSVDGELPLLLLCGRRSMFQLFHSVGIRTRTLRPFPWYRNHERYRSSADPMESRLVIPELDIEKRWFELSYPDDYPETLGAIHAV